MTRKRWRQSWRGWPVSGKVTLGDCKAVGEGVSELRVDYGPGYRVYFGQEGRTLIVLLCGGDKRTQERDIRLARQHWREYKSK